MERDLDKAEIVNLAFAQNGKGLISESEFKEEFVPLYRIGRRDHVKEAWVIKCSPRVRNRLTEQGQVYIGWDVCRMEDEAGVTRCYSCQGYGHLAVHCRGLRPYADIAPSKGIIVSAGANDQLWPLRSYS